MNDWKKAYHMLEDMESKNIYLHRLNYLISDDMRYLGEIAYPNAIRALSWESRLMALIETLPPEKGIVLYGAGQDSRRILKCFIDDERFVGFCSKDKLQQKTGYLGYKVISPEELLSRKDLSVIIATSFGMDEIRQTVECGGYPQDQIYDGPMYYNTEIGVEQYFSPDFITYEDSEVFVDAGCYDLGSSIALKRYCPNIKKVYAFEPDPGSYKQCIKQKEIYNYVEAEIFPFGTWSEKKTLHFNTRGDSGSHIAETGEEILVMPIDEVINPEEKVTFIKMDIEGAELQSLKGAKRIIQHDKPKLAICIYHKPEDMVEIPLYIKELVPEYKLYIRHHSSNVSDTVLYAVM